MAEPGLVVAATGDGTALAVQELLATRWAAVMMAIRGNGHGCSFPIWLSSATGAPTAHGGAVMHAVGELAGTRLGPVG